MHFIAMLGLRLPILFYYDAAITLASALIAILIVALALVLLHFLERTKRLILTAGGIVGAGILAMHYVGMAGMQLCQPVYTTSGIIASSALAIGLCVTAFAVAYGERSNRGVAFGAVCFALAVFAVHFLAMADTSFVAAPNVQEFGPLISNEVMAIGVILSSFTIFGAFLWVGATYLVPTETGGTIDPSAGAQAKDSGTSGGAIKGEPAPSRGAAVRIPCEREGVKVFVAAPNVAFVRADAHYTQVYTDAERFFCAWPITEASKRLTESGFLKVHRSYLVNPAMVAAFERSKDKGRCTFLASDLPPVPVSRSHLKDALAAFS